MYFLSPNFTSPNNRIQWITFKKHLNSTGMGPKWGLNEPKWLLIMSDPLWRVQNQKSFRLSWPWVWKTIDNYPPWAYTLLWNDLWISEKSRFIWKMPFFDAIFWAILLLLPIYSSRWPKCKVNGQFSLQDHPFSLDLSWLRGSKISKFQKIESGRQKTSILVFRFFEFIFNLPHNLFFDKEKFPKSHFTKGFFSAGCTVSARLLCAKRFELNVFALTIQPVDIPPYFSEKYEQK